MPDDALRRLVTLRSRCETQLRRLISRAVAGGISTQQIADAVGVSRATLWRRYRDELKPRRPSRRT